MWWKDPGSGVSAPVVTIGTPTSGTMPFSWGAIANATSYDWRYTPSGGSASAWTNVSSGTLSATASSLTPSTVYLIEVRANVVTANGKASSTTGTSSAPTTPAKRRILGRSMSNYDAAGGLFSGTNDNSYWAYSFYASAMSAIGLTGPTRWTVDTDIVNQTGKIIQKISVPFGTFTNNPAQILGVWASVNGGSTWVRLLFSGANTLSLPTTGTMLLPKFVASDPTTLLANWAPGASCRIRVTFANSGQIPSFEGFGSIATPESGMSNVTYYMGDSGSSAGVLNAATVQANTNGGSVFPHVFVEFAATEAAEVSVLAWGDSIYNEFRIYNDPTNPYCRDGIWYKLEGLNTHQYHVAPGGRGGLDPIQYEALLESSWAVYGPWVDVVLFDGYSPNNTPPIVNTTAQVIAAMDAAYNWVTSHGRAFLVGFLTPVGGNYTTFGATTLTAFNSILAHANSSYPGLVVDTHTVIQDPANIPLYKTADTVDQVHVNVVGALDQATGLEPILRTAITTYGYTV